MSPTAEAAAGEAAILTVSAGDFAAADDAGDAFASDGFVDAA